MSETSEPEQFRKLFVGKLNHKSTEESLKSYFGQWGEIEDCVVMRDSHTKISRGFGFITYKRAHMVDDAQAARPHKIDDREVETQRAVPKENASKPGAHMKVKELFVGGINDDIGEDELREYFGPYGNIAKVTVVTDKNTGKKRGFAFVEFDDYDPVDKILLQSHNYKGSKLGVEKALPRDEKGKIKMKEMGVFGRGPFAGGRGKLPTADAFHENDPVDVYRAGFTYGYSDFADWNDANQYSSGGTSGWGTNYGPSYGGGPIPRNRVYAQRSRGPYGRRRSCRYGQQ